MYLLYRADKGIVAQYELLEDAEEHFEELPSDGNSYLDSWDDIDFEEWNGDMDEYMPDTTLECK